LIRWNVDRSVSYFFVKSKKCHPRCLGLCCFRDGETRCQHVLSRRIFASRGRCATTSRRFRCRHCGGGRQRFQQRLFDLREVVLEYFGRSYHETGCTSVVLQLWSVCGLVGTR
jgi:hypothetical protein